MHNGNNLQRVVRQTIDNSVGRFMYLFQRCLQVLVNGMPARGMFGGRFNPFNNPGHHAGCIELRIPSFRASEDHTIFTQR
jgi:hypothetical protein